MPLICPRCGKELDAIAVYARCPACRARLVPSQGRSPHAKKAELARKERELWKQSLS